MFVCKCKINHKTTIIDSKEDIIALLMQRLEELKNKLEAKLNLHLTSFSDIVQNKPTIVDNVPNLIIKPKKIQRVEITTKHLQKHTNQVSTTKNWNQKNKK